MSFASRFLMVVALLCLSMSVMSQDLFGAPPLSAPGNAGPPPVTRGDDPFGEGRQDPVAGPWKRIHGAVKPSAAVSKEENQTREAKHVELDPEQVILQKLDCEISQSFNDEPLESALRVSLEQFDIPFVIDNAALEELGLTLDTPVTIDLKNVKLRSFLTLMLRSNALTYAIKNEVLMVTSQQAAESMPVLRSYALPQMLGDKSDKVLKALISTVTPDAWSTAGGFSHASMVEHVLIVSSTEQVQESVVEFIAKLQAAFERSAAASR